MGAGAFRVFISQITADELNDAPPAVHRILRGLPRFSIERITAGNDALELAMAYITAEVLSSAQRADAIHVATATVARADLILSWNFKHIVNFDRNHKFNAVNLMRDYPQIEIRSPLEVEYGYENQDI